LLCPDFRGHGGSELGPDPVSLPQIAADVTALWDRLGIQRTAVFGVSLGGMVGQAVLATQPSNVDAYVIMATTRTYDDAARARAEAARTAGGMAQLQAMTLQRWFGDAASDDSDPLVARARAQFLAADAEVHARYLEAMTEVGSLVLPATRALPILVLGAADD